MRTRVVAAWLVAGVLAAGRPVVAQDTTSSAQQTAVPERFGPTMQFGTGLIFIPTAWVSPQNGDFFISVSGVRIPSAIDATNDLLAYFNGNAAIDTHWLGRFDAGVSIYSNNPEYGFFGSILALKDGQFSRWLPAVSVGFRNLGPYTHEDRYLIGHDITVDPSGAVHGFTPFYFEGFHTAPTVYIVATKSIALPVPVPSSVSLTVGEGNGLFSQTGGLGAEYNNKGQVAPGFFFGVQGMTHPFPGFSVAILGENDGFDYNAGVRVAYRGLGVGVYGSELQEGGRHLPQDFLIYNYKKLNVVFSYAGNFLSIAHGVLLRSQISELEHERAVMRTEIARRERRIQQLQVTLNKLQGSALSDVDRQRQALESQLKDEQDAIRRANERLQQLQQGQQPQVVPPATPQSPPPQSPPPQSPPPGQKPQ